MAEPINIVIDGNLKPLRQRGANDCWAVAATMLLSWQQNRNITVEQTISLAGAEFLELYVAEGAIHYSQMPSFLDSLSLKAEPPICLSVAGIAALLSQHGPIWITIDVDPSDEWSGHAKIIYGLQGDGSPENTMALVLDPNKESPIIESVAQIHQQFNQLATFDVRFGVNIAQYIHF